MPQIEVEKKFDMSKKRALTKLLQGAKDLGIVNMEDIYYDTPDYKFIKKGMRLRKRDGAFELKVSISEMNKQGADQRSEIEDPAEILRAMGFSSKDNLEAIVNGQFTVLCKINTVRHKYQRGDIHIDLDVTDFGYDMGEIEILVETKAEVAEAERKILELATSCGIELKKMPGKVAECLRVTRPEVYKELYSDKSREMKMK